MSRERFHVRAYQPPDETQWIRCRVLAFLDCAYYDNVLREKPIYANPSVELVAEMDKQIIGFLDIELESQPGTICSKGAGLGGMIWELGVHPDYRRRGVATSLLAEGKRQAKGEGLVRLEAWTRDDKWVQAWYEAQGFTKVDSYFHVWIPRTGNGAITTELEDLRLITSYAHYTGKDTERIRDICSRIHECCCFELHL